MSKKTGLFFIAISYFFVLFFSNCKPADIFNVANPSSKEYYLTGLLNEFWKNLLVNQTHYLIFWGNDGMSDGVYRSDGTPEGTYLLMSNIHPATIFTDYAKSVPMGQNTYFQGCESSPVTYTNCELWVTNGTPEGTYMLKDIYPGSTSGTLNSGFPFYFTKLHDKVYFNAMADGINYELWSTDGTPNGTVQITTGNINASYIINLNNILYFTGNDNTNGFELWKSDGTAIGTTLLNDICSGSPSGNPIYSVAALDKIFFSSMYCSSGLNELTVSDGSGNGFTWLTTTGIDPSYITEMNGNVYFRSNVASSPPLQELWVSDGTVNGTKKITANSLNPLNMIAFNGMLYFNGYDAANGMELWFSDGTLAGTKLIKDLEPGSANSSPQEVRVINGKIIFAAYTAADGYEPWIYDPAQQTGSDNPKILKSINQGSGSGYGGFTIP